MNGKERIAAAMRFQPVDRVPVMCQLTLGHYFINMKNRYKPHEIWFTSEAFADSLVTMQGEYRFDGILVNMPGRDPKWRDTVESIEDTAEGEWITFKDGYHVLVPWDDNALFEPKDPTAAPYPDYDSFDPGDMERIYDYPRYVWGVYHTHQLPPEDARFRTVDRVMAQVGGAISVHGETFSPFTHFMELFGYQNALMGMVTDPDKAHAVLNWLVGVSAEWGKALAGRGVDAVLISSAFAGGGFISPRMYKQFVVPYERQVVEAIRAAYPETPVYTHTCGHLNDRLELFMESGTGGIDTLDPPPLGDTDLADAKARIGERMFIKGNLNSVAILDDDEQSYRERVMKTLRAGAPGGGYILSSACSVSPRVEPWKMAMLVDLVEAFQD